MPHRARRVTSPYVLGVTTLGVPYGPTTAPARTHITASPRKPEAVPPYPNPRPVWTQLPNIPKQWAPLPSQGTNLNDG
jgi:hypothetical protein